MILVGLSEEDPICFWGRVVLLAGIMGTSFVMVWDGVILQFWSVGGLRSGSLQLAAGL